MDTTCKNKESSQDFLSGNVLMTSQLPHSALADHTTVRPMSPRRILTTTSSSGSDPLASPGSEAISDGDMQSEHLLLLPGTSVAPGISALPANMTFRIGNPTVQAGITMLEKQFIMQKEILSRQFEEQCRLLDNEKQAQLQEYLKVQEYLKMLSHQHHKEEISEMKRKIDEDQMMKYKNKRKTDESAVASTAVKLKLRECLLNKSRSEHQTTTDSPPELRSTQHSSLDQHSPPTNTKWSPPLHVLNRFEDEYPLRKTVSEPTLKMKSCKISLRQRVMQRNNQQLVKRREMYKRKSAAPFDHDSSPNSPPLFDSHGSSVDETKSSAGLENRMQLDTPGNIQLPDSYASQMAAMSLAGLKRELMAPGHYGSLPLVGDGGGFFPALQTTGARTKPPYNMGSGSDIASQVGAFSGLSAGIPCQLNRNDTSSLTEAYVQALLIARSSLPRTRSEPLPLPVQLLLQQQFLKSHEFLQKDPNKYFLKQKLLQQAGAKKLMENVDESVERQIPSQEYLGCSAESEEEVDVIVIDDARTTQDVAQGDPTKILEESGVQMAETNMETSSSTGLVYDPMMLKHVCSCQNNSFHPENPDRLVAIWKHFNETGYVEKCQLIKSRRAMKEELQSCHREVYVHMYASTQSYRDPLVLETFSVRFCQLPCGGIGVDSDTVWNEQYTTTAARIAAGSVIELSHRVATGEIQNGFAIVRPPGHHAEDMQAMGFCYFNSIAIATKQLLDKLHMRRVLIIDWDVHHGNATQQAFYADPRVLYISLHRYDNGNFFPGTGDPGECGIDRGQGFNVNIGWCDVPMSDAEYLAAFRSVVMPIAGEFKPEIVMVSAGFDAAKGHPAPLGGYNLSPQCFGFMTRELMTLANQKVVLVLEGGYELVPLADSALCCLKALLNEALEPIETSELCRPPCQHAVEALLTVLKNQVSYWPCLRQYSESISLSHLESQQRWNQPNLPFF